MWTRDDILKEMKRTAKDNGGIPLSEKRFKEQTGIVYEWHKYWPRFGDLQREAGLNPNKFLKIPYKDIYLIKSFISLIRELKKWPTKGEILVKHSTNKNFPGEHVFYKRLGLKPVLANTILVYSKRNKYNDVVKICEEVLKEFDHPEQPTNLREDTTYSGFVYLAKSGSYYKIGRTNDMSRRHHEITIQLPDGFELIHEIKTDDPSGIESYWHKRFESKHKRGEWFALNSSDVNAFRRWKKIS